ncbi:MAG: 16S rRNA processing protein RimM [Ruminococcaceae bacterium]|nr:16S rRNA processing protein RimM [Oscillospiraceae bacterium]
MLKQYLEVGQIVGTHGVRGEVRVNPWCDTPEFLKKFRTLYFDAMGERAVKVLSSRVHGNIVLMQLEGISTVEEAAVLRNKVVYMNRKDAKIPDNSYFIQDLIDCKVIDADNGTEYGVLTNVSETGANDVWHITKDGKEYLIPAIPPVVIETDVVSGVIKIRPLRGIFDDEN